MLLRTQGGSKLSTAFGKRHRLIFSVLGMAVAIPLIAVPASAALDGGAFFVKAQNTESPEYAATAGLRGTAQEGETPGGENPGGGSDEGENPGLAVVSNFDCGSLSLRITQDMVDFAKSNEAAVAAGGQAQTHPEGWQSIRTLDSSRKDIAGLPEDPSSARGIVLFRDMAKSYNPNSTSALVSGTSSPNGQCSLKDFREAPAANNVYAYSNDTPNGYYSEARYIDEGGTLSAVNVQLRNDGSVSVDRSTSPRNTTPYLSNTLPQRFTLNDNGLISFQMHLVDPQDGYQRIFFEKRADGSGSVTYTSDDYLPAIRAQGPSSISWDSQGRFTEFTDSEERSVMAGEVGPFTAADYNAKTGKSWDGVVTKPTDFDLTVPFYPTSPVSQDM